MGTGTAFHKAEPDIEKALDPVFVFIRETTNLFEFVDRKYFEHFGQTSKSARDTIGIYANKSYHGKSLLPAGKHVVGCRRRRRRNINFYFTMHNYIAICEATSCYMHSRLTNAGLMPGRCHCRWDNVKPALVKRLVFAVILCVLNVCRQSRDAAWCW